MKPQFWKTTGKHWVESKGIKQWRERTHREIRSVQRLFSEYSMFTAGPLAIKYVRHFKGPVDKQRSKNK